MRHLLSCTDVDERSLCGGGLRTVADPQLCVHGLSQLLHEWVMNPTLNQKAVGADTGLRQRQVQDIIKTIPSIHIYRNILDEILLDPWRKNVTSVINYFYYINLKKLTWPEFLNLEAIAPATALSTSALSKTMKGAWPPSSIDTLLTVPAACLSSICKKKM